MPSADQPTDARLESACRKGALLLAIAFFALYLPALPSLSHWRGDERFYTDAAVAMDRSGDWLTPVYPDGSLRFKKPILPYWAVLSGFKLFGFNYLGSRFAFLAAGTLVVWITFELCLALTRRPRESLIATAIVASNLTMHNTSIRSTPDMLLCLFVLTSLLGFVNLFFGKIQRRWHALAYAGAGLAMATKGLSGLLPVAYAFLFATFSRRLALSQPVAGRITPRKLRDLAHPLFIALSLAAGSAWFVWAFSRHGAAAVSDFFGDQVGERFSGSKLYILENAGVYLSSFFVQLLPWPLLALVALWIRRGAVREAFRPLRGELLFAAGWPAFLLVVFTGGNIQRTRYFLPAYPFLALFYAVTIATLSGNADERGDQGATAAPKSALGRLLGGFYAVALVLATGLAVLGYPVAPRLGLAGIALAVAAAALGWAARKWETAPRVAGAAAYIILAFSVNLLLILPTFRFSAADEIVTRLAGSPVGGRPPPPARILPMTGMDVGEASQIRVLSRGTLDARIVPAKASAEALKTNGWIVCTQGVLDTWQPIGVRVDRCGTGSNPWKLRDYLALVRARDKRGFLESKAVSYFLVTADAPGAAIQPAAAAR